MSAKDIILAASASAVGGAQAETDPYFANTTLLLQGDVSNPDLTYNAFSDASGNGVNITPNGDARGSSFSPYNTSWSVYFPNNTDEIRLSSNSNNALGTGVFTIEAWIYLESTAGEGILAQRGGSTNRWIFWVESNKLNFKHNDISFYSTSTIPTYEWVHVAYVREGTGTNQAKLYINGQLDATGTTGVNFTQTNDLVIGDGRSDSGAIFNGYISNVRLTKAVVYNGAFTPSTSNLTVDNDTYLLACHTNRFINGVTGEELETSNTPRVSGFSPFLDTDTTTGSGYFDGSDDVIYAVQTGAEFTYGTGDYDYECWVYPNSTTTGQETLFGRDNTGNTSVPYIYIQPTNRRFGLYYSSIILNGTSTAVPFSWTHIVVSRVSGTVRLFVNGVQEASASDSTSLTSAGKLVVGGQWTGNSNMLNGYIAGARVRKGVGRTSVTVPTSPVASDANTQLLTCQTRGAVRNIGFRDESEYNHVITKVGNCAQGTFSPFSQEEGKWSIFKDGDSRITSPNTSGYQFGTGDFTVEAFIYVPSGPAGDYMTSGWGVIAQCAASGGWSNGWTLATQENSSILRVVWYENGSAPLAGTAIPRDKWVHVVVARSGTSIRLFYDGVVVDTATSSANYAPTRELSIGGENTGTSYQFKNGYISNVRVVKGTALYTSAFTVPTEPLSSVANTSLLTLGFNRIFDLSSPSKSFTATGNLSVQPFSPFSPSAAYDPDVNGGSVYLDGSASNRLTIPDSDTAFAFGTSNYTVEAWVYPFNAGVTSAPIFNQSNGGASSDSSFFMALQSDGVAHYVSDGTGWDYNATNSSLSLGRQWNHVAWVRSGAVIYSFVNGVQQASATVGAGFALGNSSRVIEVGAQNATNYFTGFIHGLKVTRGSALYTGAYTVPTAPPTPTSNTSLLLNFTNAGVIDATGRNVIETVGNAHVETSVKKYGTGALEFNGTTDELVIPWSEFWTIGAGDYTVECWLKTTDAQGEIVGAFNSASPFRGWLFGVGFQNSDGKLQLYNANSSNSEVKKSTATVNDGNWNYVVMSKQGSTVRFYINGSLDSTHTLSYVGTGSDQPIRIARDPNPTPGRYLAANIDDLRITKGVARYTGSSHTVPTKSLPNQ